jgi:hypothetical protein
MKRWGLEYGYFRHYIRDLPRRKAWKAINESYLQRTWDHALTPPPLNPLSPPPPPSHPLLLHLSSSVFPDTGIKSETSRSEGVALKVDKRVLNSRKLIAGFLLWKYSILSWSMFKVARVEIARVTGLTEKTVGVRLHDLEDLGLIRLTKTWKTQRGNFIGEPRHIDIQALIERAGMSSIDGDAVQIDT